MRIHNTASGRSEELAPLQAGHVRMYVCGMTVYDLCHIGHARVMVVFDLVARYLRWRGLNVQYVRNITDIDDKIIRRAQENQESCEALTERFIAAMHEDAGRLGVLRPDAEPCATHYMPQIIAMVEKLVAGGYAYPADNGDVYYRVKRFAGYGSLSGKKLDELVSGSRVDVDPAKEDPLDFVLWKASKPGEPAWDSPWGSGRPGWHIECSAMSTCCLGDSFDIHGGGGDLVFPHHENEIAQSEAATGKPFVQTWMHVGYVQINDEKMSKSLGNFFTIREVLDVYEPEIVRYFLLASHYRSPLNYSTDNLDSARAALLRLYGALDDAPALQGQVVGDWAARFQAAMDDDFNTPEALAVLFDLVRELNRARQEHPEQVADLVATLRALGGVLGLLEQEPQAFLKAGVAGDLPDDEVDILIAAREAARGARNWAEADRIRDQLTEAGIELLDSREGTRWRRA